MIEEVLEEIIETKEINEIDEESDDNKAMDEEIIVADKRIINTVKSSIVRSHQYPKKSDNDDENIVINLKKSVEDNISLSQQESVMLGDMTNRNNMNHAKYRFDITQDTISDFTIKKLQQRKERIHSMKIVGHIALFLLKYICVVMLALF